MLFQEINFYLMIGLSTVCCVEYRKYVDYEK